MEDDDYDLQKEVWELKQKKNKHCQCGYPDWPGSCPGPDNCPLCEEDDDC